MLASQHPHTTDRPGQQQPDFTAILLTMLRLERQQTDVLISINVPHVPGEYDAAQLRLEAGEWGPLVGAAVKHRDEILKTFRVLDWALFVQE